MSYLADKVAISPNYLHTLFKNKTGQTLLDYITNRRIDAAKRLLEDPYNRIYEISEKVGYKSTNYFTTIFKNIVGMTPSEYRKSGIKDG